MRELTLIECAYAAGGIYTDGYNFSHIISSALIFGIVGTLFGVDPITAASVGAAYGTIMMVAKIGDAYFFPEETIVKPVVVAAA